MTLKPRQGSVSAGVVKQSFSHGRTKTVVVETKRTRPHAPAAGNLAAPSSAERRHGETPAPRPSQPQGGGGGSAGGLSQEELRARQRVVIIAEALRASFEDFATPCSGELRARLVAALALRGPLRRRRHLRGALGGR